MEANWIFLKNFDLFSYIYNCIWASSTRQDLSRWAS